MWILGQASSPRASQVSNCNHRDILSDHRLVPTLGETKVVNLDCDAIHAMDVPVARIDGSWLAFLWICALKQLRRYPAVLGYTAFTQLAAAHLHHHASLVAILIESAANLQKGANVFLRVPQLR